MLKIMLNLAKASVEKSCQGNFDDLNSSDWGCSYAETALKLGYIAPNKKYRPNDNVSKIEAVKMIFKALNIDPIQTNDWKIGYVQVGSNLKVFTDDNYLIFNYDEKSTRGWIFYIANSSYINKLGSVKKFEDEYTITYSQPFYEVGNLEYLSNSHNLKFIGREDKSKQDNNNYLIKCSDWFNMNSADIELSKNQYPDYYNSLIPYINSCNKIFNDNGYKNVGDYNNKIFEKLEQTEKETVPNLTYNEYLNFSKGIKLQETKIIKGLKEGTFIDSLGETPYYIIPDNKLAEINKGEEIVKELFNGNLKLYHGNTKLNVTINTTYLNQLFGNNENQLVYFGNIGDISKVEFSPNGKNYIFYFSYLTDEEVTNANKKFEVARKTKECLNEVKGVNNGSTDPGDTCNKLSYYLPKFHDILILNGNIVQPNKYKFKYKTLDSTTFTNLSISDNGGILYNPEPFFDLRIVDSFSGPIGDSTKSNINYNGYNIEIEGGVENWYGNLNGEKSDDGKSISFIVSDSSIFPIMYKKVVKIDKK